MKITTYSRLTWKGNSATSGLEGIFASKLKPCICSRSISARAIGSLLTLKLIGSDWRLRLLHFHVNLIKKKSEVVRRRDGDSLQMEYNGGAEADKTHYHQFAWWVPLTCSSCRASVDHSAGEMLKLFSAATRLRSESFQRSQSVYSILHMEANQTDVC